MSDPGKLTLTVSQKTVAKDASGSAYETWTTYQSGLVGYLRNQSPMPGRYMPTDPTMVRVRTEKLIVFYRSENEPPAVSVDYSYWRLTDEDGLVYGLRQVNEYETTVQWLVERVL